MSIFSKQKPLAPLLSLDLGASGVKCLLALPEEKNKKSLRLLAKSFAPYPSNSFLGGEIKVYAAVLAACRTALAGALACANELPNADFSPKDVVLGFSDESISLKLSVVRYRRPRPASPLTSQELDLLYKKIEKKSAEAFPDFSLLDSRPLSVSIDGYTPLAPVGFKGEELVVEYLTSFALDPLIKDIKRLCSELGLYPLALTSNAFALARACLGPDSDPDLSALLLDVGSATTNLALLDSGEFVSGSTFSIGSASFEHRSGEALDNALATWFSALTLALEDFSSLVPNLPPVLILAGGASRLLTLQETLESADWGSLSFASAPNIVYLTPADLPGFSLPADLPLGPEDLTGMGLLRLGADIRKN